jgi:CDP-glycerol glycerophosphotransferase (TagB/SpsB family)
VAVARLLGIPSLVLDHGLTADIQQPRGFLDLFADKMANWGDGNRELLLRHGLAPDRLVVTGAPKFDASLQAARGSRARLCQELGIDPQQRLVVYAAHPDVLWYTSRDWHQWELVSLLGQALAEIPNCQLVLRPHPSDKTLCQEHLPGDLKSEAVIARDANLYNLLIHCDLLITETSTVGLEAMLFDKPVMILNLRGRPDLVPYVERGAALGVYDLPDLAQAIQAALDEEAVRERLGVARKAFTSYYLDRLDGRSSERVVGLILQMAAERKKE